MRGFTFAQLATLMIVILGLVVVVVLVSTQFRKTGSGFSDIGETATSGVDAATETAQGLSCDLADGTCKSSCDGATENDGGQMDCPSDESSCCVPK